MGEVFTTECLHLQQNREKTLAEVQSTKYKVNVEVNVVVNVVVPQLLVLLFFNRKLLCFCFLTDGTSWISIPTHCFGL